MKGDRFDKTHAGLRPVLVCMWLASIGTAVSAENYAYPPDVAAWTEQTKDAQREAARRLVARLKEAVDKGESALKVKPGHYRFGRRGPKNFELRGFTDLELDAAGATFWFEGRLRLDSIVIRECRNLSIKELTVDYDPLCYSQGEIVEIDRQNRSVSIRIDPGFPLPDDSWTRREGSIKAIFYDENGRQIEVRMDWIKSLARLDGRVFRVEFKHGWMFQPGYPSDVKVGDRLTLPDRSMRHTFSISGSESVTLEDITIYACPQMAFVETGGRGGNVYRRCRVIRRPGTQRLLACNADAFHSAVVAKGPLIEQCEFSHAGDDFINIHGFFSMVYEQPSPQKVVVVAHYIEDNFSPGSELAFYRFDDFTPIGARRIKTMRLIEDPAVFEAAGRMPEELRRSGKRVRDFHPRNVYPFLVELDGPVSVKKYDIVGCDDRIGRGAVVRSNYFHDGFARGILLSTADAVVENNTIERTGIASVCIAAERYWLQGPFPHDIVVRNNKITDNGTMLLSRNRNCDRPGAVTVISLAGHGLSPAIQNHHIRIAGNKITRPSACGVFVANARDCEIEDNIIEEPFAGEPFELGRGLGIGDPTYAIYLASAERIILRRNKVVRPTKYCSGDIGLGKWVNDETIEINRE